MSFFFKKNLSAFEVQEMPEPWEYHSTAPYDDMTKAEFQGWSALGSTDHAFISLAEGVTPGLAVTKQNPPLLLRGFIADYDGVTAEDPVKAMLAKFKGAYVPSWYVRSRGNGAHVVWLFEEPFTCMDFDHAKRFLNYFQAKVRANRLFGGYDRGASITPSTYMEIGREWIPVPGAQIIPTSMLRMWDHECYVAHRTKAQITADIPMDVLADEVEKRWPGRVKNFMEGARCLRFWDPISDNEDGCVIYAEGVRVYVTGPNGIHDYGFKTWTDILGPEFVDEYKSTKYEDMLDDVWFVPTEKRFYFWDDYNRRYQIRDYHMMADKLTGMGFSNRKPTGGISETTEVIQYIADHRYVDRVVEFLYKKRGLIKMRNGDRFLNVSMVRPIDFGPPLVENQVPWLTKECQEAFPFTHSIITSLFQDPDNFDAPIDPQLEYLLVWMAYYYKCAYNMDPAPGQVLFLCGGRNVGKTFFSRRILAELMGGSSDASHYFLGTREWNAEMARGGVMTIDDSQGATDMRAASVFQARLKAFVANGTIRIMQKYKQEFDSEMLNRLVVTLNDDAVSRQILPPLDATITDKVSLLKLSNDKYRRPLNNRKMSNSEREKEVLKELPMLARWLYEHEIADKWKDARFGTVAVRHPDLDRAAGMESGAGREIMEALKLAFEGMDDEATHWKGTATQLHALLSNVSRAIERNLTSLRVFTRALARLESDGWDIVSHRDPKDDITLYEINRNVATLGRVHKQYAKEPGELISE